MITTRQCTTCKLTKPLDQFYIRKSGRLTGKPRSTCIDCERQYRLDNKDIYIKWKQDHPDYARRRDLKRKFGITLEEYNAKSAAQNQCCAICSTPQTELDQALSVDHDHTTGKLRGLLCNECNFGLGKFKDNLAYIKNAVTYLEQHTN